MHGLYTRALARTLDQAVKVQREFTRVLAHILLWTIGWRFEWRNTTPDEYTHVVFAFAHDSHFDAFVAQLVMWAYPERFPYATLVVWEGLLQRFPVLGPYFLKYAFAGRSIPIKGTKSDDTKRILREQKRMMQREWLGRMQLFIAPEGAIRRNLKEHERTRLRSGVKYIAKDFDATIIPVLFDYSKQAVIVSGSSFNGDMEWEDLEKALLAEFNSYPRLEVNFDEVAKLRTCYVNIPRVATLFLCFLLMQRFISVGRPYSALASLSLVILTGSMTRYLWVVVTLHRPVLCLCTLATMFIEHRVNRERRRTVPLTYEPSMLHDVGLHVLKACCMILNIG